MATNQLSHDSFVVVLAGGEQSPLFPEYIENFSNLKHVLKYTLEATRSST